MTTPTAVTMCDTKVISGTIARQDVKVKTIAPWLHLDHGFSGGRAAELFACGPSFTAITDRASDTLATIKVAPAPLKKKRSTSPHRYHPDTVVLRSGRYYQRGTGLLMQTRPFRRTVRSIVDGLDTDVKFDDNAIMTLQEAAENYLVAAFHDANATIISQSQCAADKRLQRAGLRRSSRVGRYNGSQVVTVLTERRSY